MNYIMSVKSIFNKVVKSLHSVFLFSLQEAGGYFVINGIEKVIRMLILPRRNFVSSPVVNPLSPNIHTQIPYTDLHTFYERIS